MSRNHDGKHLPNATSSFGEPLMRIFLRSKAHSKLRSFARKPSHVSLSAVTLRSDLPRCPSSTLSLPSRMVIVACFSSLPVNEK